MFQKYTRSYESLTENLRSEQILILHRRAIYFNNRHIVYSTCKALHDGNITCHLLPVSSEIFGICEKQNGELHTNVRYLRDFQLKMQEDSPGRQDKRTRNDRYSTSTKPKQLSVASARHKAKEFAAKDDKATRVLAKQAILKELSSHLIVKAEGIAPQNRKTREKRGNEAGIK